MKNTHTWIRVIGRLATDNPELTDAGLVAVVVPMLDDDGAYASKSGTDRTDALVNRARHLVGLWRKGHTPAKRTTKRTTGDRPSKRTTGTTGMTLPSTEDRFAPGSTKRNGRVRDYQRSKCYGWERSLPGWNDRQLELWEIDELVQQVCSDYGIPVIPTTDGRGRRSACFGFNRIAQPTIGAGQIIMTWDETGELFECNLRFPRGLRQRQVVLHELAHYFNSHIHGFMRLSSHGSEFVAIACHLYGRYLGTDTETEFRQDASDNAGLHVAPR